MSRVARLSITLNVVLLALLAWQWRARSADDVIGPPGAVRQTGAPAATTPDKHARVSAKPATKVAIGAGWQSWIEPLRRAGVPTDVLAGLVRADFERRWQPRQAEMQQKYLHGDIDSDALAAFALEHDRESDRDLAAALGPDEYRRWDMDRVLKELPPAAAALTEPERAAVYELERNLRDDLRQSELDKLQGAMDQATLTQREQAARDAVAAKLREILGPERAAQLQGADDTEGNLRRSLKGTPVSDDQLKALAQARRDWDNTRSKLVTLETETENPAYGEMAAAAADKYAAKFEQIAGPQALDQATEREDSRFNDLQRHAAEWKLSPSDTNDVYQTLATIDGAVREYRLDAATRGVDAAVQTDAIRTLQRQSIATLTEKLGADRVAALQRNGVLPSP